MKTILYQHIPKTGGQTLATRIASAFPIGRSSILGPDINYPDGIGDLRSLLGGHDFVERHINGPILAEFEELDILVTVREPVSQLVSNYLHILREPASSLHRPAKLLSPQAFFGQFGDLLANHQTRYFVSAYRDLHPDIERLITWSSVMLGCLERVRWFVPTEAIDEFCMLWQLETGRQMLLAEERINVASDGSGRRKELEDIVANMPELYSIDLLLWQIARQRYGDYKRRVLGRSIANPFPDNWGHVWAEDGCGIWLGRGWYQPQTTPLGIEYWAGPERLSEIRFKRDVTRRYLTFSIIVYCGIYEGGIQFVTADGRVLTPTYHRVDEQEVVYVVDLDGADEENLIWLLVPEVWSPVMVSLETTDTSRKSVATCNWKLTAMLPFDAAGADACVSAAKNIRNLHAGDGHGVDAIQSTG